MARSRSGAFEATASWSVLLLLVVAFLTLCQPSLAAGNNPAGTKYVQVTTSDGQTLSLPDNRKPALYTKNFGDCLGSSLINVTRFDAAYYKDNMTVLFHLQGNTAVRNESLMSMGLPRKSWRLWADGRQCTLVSSHMARVDSNSPSIHAMQTLLGKSHSLTSSILGCS